MAEFLTVNLKSILNNQRPAAKTSTPSEPQGTDHEAIEINMPAEWASLLNDMLEANNKLSPEARIDEQEIESEFFEDYFSNAHQKWNSVCSKQLLSMGEPLRKVLKVLGFDPKVNPILGFLLTDFGVELMQEKLLNINTFKYKYF